MQPLISPHFNLTVEMPLKALVRGYSYAVVPITWTNRAAGVSKLKIKEMGSRYLFIVLYLWLEKHLARGDYHRRPYRSRPKGPPTSMHETVLITGGAGFVGSTLAIAIRRAYPGPTVIAFDNLRRRGSEMNLPRLKAEGVQFVHGDVRSLADLSGIRPGAGPDSGVLRRALRSGRLRRLARVPDPHQSHRLLPLPGDCAPAKADFLFVSTSRVYPVAPLNALAFDEDRDAFRCAPSKPCAGASEHGISETFPLDGARSLYGMTKLAGGTDGGRIWRRLRHPLRHRSLRPAHRPLADGQGGSGRGGLGWPRIASIAA